MTESISWKHLFELIVEFCIWLVSYMLFGGGVLCRHVGIPWHIGF